LKDQVFPKAVSGATTVLSGNVTSATKAAWSHPLVVAVETRLPKGVAVGKIVAVFVGVSVWVALGWAVMVFEMWVNCTAAVWAADV
jgi:hypothetical protein